MELRLLSGNGEWSLNTPWNSKDAPKEIQDLLGDTSRDLGYSYKPGTNDKYKHALMCVRQRGREQLVVYYPKWRPDLKKIESSPL